MVDLVVTMGLATARRTAVRGPTPHRVAGRWGLAAIVTGSAVALGTVHTLTLAVVAISLVVVLALLSWDEKPMVARRPAGIVVAVGVGLVVWTFVQQLPLPAELVSAVAPVNADIWSRALTPLREEGPRWVTISLDPTATRVQLLRGVTLLLAYAGALRVASRTEGVKFLERTVLASATIVGVAALVHPLLGAERIFGLWKPETAEFGTRVAPLLNSNHLSAYLNMGSCAALAWALSRASRVHRAIPIAIYVFLVLTQIWVASRAGVAAMVLGSAAVMWFLHRSSAPGRTMPWRYILPGVFALAGVAMALLATQDRALYDLTNDDSVKLTLLRRAVATVPAFLWVGMGRGSFESVFNAFRSDSEGHIVFTHAENVAIQWMAEWGAPAALAALLALAIALRPSVALARSSVPAGPAAGLTAVVAHNMLDFSVEIPAVAIALAVYAACVTGGRSDASREGLGWWTRRPLLGVALAATATFPLAAVVLLGRPHELHAEQARLRDLALSTATPREAFVAEARAAMLRHPAEPYLPLMGAVRAARTRDESAIPWIGRALERASVYGRAHLLLARQLGRRHPSQARLEYRLAMEQDYNLIGTALQEGLSLVRETEDALQLVPDGRHAELVLEQLAVLLRDRSPAAADGVLDALAARNPASPLVARAAAQRALAALTSHDPACDRERPRCLDAALVAVDRLMQIAPRACSSHQVAAAVRAEGGDVERAYEELERAIDGVDDRAPCLDLLVDLAVRVGDERRITHALERLVQGACTSDAECARAHLRAASVEENRRNPRRALAHGKRAQERTPERAEVLSLVGRLAEAAGAYADAIDAYRTLASREPTNPAWPEGMARARAAQDAARSRALGIGN